MELRGCTWYSAKLWIEEGKIERERERGREKEREREGEREGEREREPIVACGYRFHRLVGSQAPVF